MTPSSPRAHDHAVVSDVRLSRAVAHALRHAPWLYELELDGEGWAPVDQLLEALRSKGGHWSGVDHARLGHMLATASKRRYELDGDRIRALYGHSLPAVIARVPADPPRRLFHGTDPRTWRVIEAEGLRPMRRQYVHLSTDRSTAAAVGRRKSDVPLVLLVRAAEAAHSGVRFYVGNDLVWLADGVPSRFLQIAQ